MAIAMQKHFVIDNGVLREGTDGVQRIDVYTCPEAEERKALLAELRMDEHDLASALDPEEVSRIDVDGERTFIVWKRPKSLSSREIINFEVGSVGASLEGDRLVLIQADDVNILDDRKVQTAKTLKELLVRLLQATVQHFQGHLRAIKQVSRELQVRLNTSMENDVFLQMFGLSESLIHYVNALEVNAGLFARLDNLSQRMGFATTERELIEDLVIDNRQCQRQAEIYASIMSGLMDARGNIINNNMNVLLKNLTIINIVFLPLNLIASMGGMSEFSEWTSWAPWEISYALFSLGMILVGVVTWKLLNKRIERRKS